MHGHPGSRGKGCGWVYHVQESGVQPAKKMLKAVGGWPLLGEGGWKEDDFTWWLLHSVHLLQVQANIQTEENGPKLPNYD